MTGPDSSPSTDPRQDDPGHGCCNWCGVRTVAAQDSPVERNRVLACSARCSEALQLTFWAPRIILTEPLRDEEPSS